MKILSFRVYKLPEAECTSARCTSTIFQCLPCKETDFLRVNISFDENIAFKPYERLLNVSFNAGILE